MMPSKPWQLSTSALNVMADCRRCFYLDRKMKAPRVRGIFPSLPGGVDLMLKERLSAFRGQMPAAFACPELAGWRLYSDTESRLDSWRQWNSKGALRYTDKKGNILVGGLDEVLENGAGLLAVADYKTKGAEAEQESCEKYYQVQLDNYSLLLSASGFDVADFGALFYFWPTTDEVDLVRFVTKTFIMGVSPARARALFYEAIDLLESTEIPDASPKCEYCKNHSARSEALHKCLIG